ncbi:TPA: DUF3383 family protein [Klebsiella oxytoca]|nr:DUF3383 family protein [Klebsiella oxytoca]
MGYSVDNIIPVNFILTASGLGYADFTSAFAFAEASDMAGIEGAILTEDGSLITTESGQPLVVETAGASTRAADDFAIDTFRDYSSETEVGQDFPTTSDIYMIATRYFAQIPRPKTLSVWMTNPDDANLIETINKANEAAWRYNYFFKKSSLTDSTLLQLSDWSDTTDHPVWYTDTAETAIDQNNSDILSRLAAKGNRHMFAGWRTQESVDAEPSQVYSMVQVAATFAKFRPTGLNTAITAEYQVLPGIDGDELKDRHYKALKAKKAVFFTPVELAGEKDSCRVINSVSMSAYGEFIDDVVNLDILKNHLQVDGYNHIANVGTKRPLTPKGYAGLLNVLSNTLKRFYDNGVLGEGSYTDEETGETKIAEFGFVIKSKAEDVLELTSAQRKRREYPPIKILVILARAGHVAELNITVE